MLTWRPAQPAAQRRAHLSEPVTENERMLTGGFYAELTSSYDRAIAQEQSGRPFGIAGYDRSSCRTRSAR